LRYREYVRKKGYKRLASLYSTDAFGQVRHFQTCASWRPQYGYEIVAAEELRRPEDTNFNAPARPQSAPPKPDLIYSSASGRALDPVLQAVSSQLGITHAR